MTRDFLWIAGAYLLAGLAAYLAGFAVSSHHPITVVVVADVSATLVVFGFSYLWGNSSVYDPYWSVAPVPIAFYWAFADRTSQADSARLILVLVLVSLWALRLTLNWAQRWRGLTDEDWRYAGFRQKRSRSYWLISFTGFHLMPTGMVFLGCLSLYPAIAAGEGGFGLLDILAVVVAAGAICIEARSDAELRRYRFSGDGPAGTFSKGIWTCSRHPNYFGEIAFWWGLYLFGLAAEPDYWPTVVGPVCITLMFLFISIPLMERRMLARHVNYADYMRRTSMLIPWPPRKGR